MSTNPNLYAICVLQSIVINLLGKYKLCYNCKIYFVYGWYSLDWEMRRIEMVYIENQLTYEEYIALRISVGWNVFDERQTRTCINGGLYSVVVRENEEAIAMGRLLGDGMYFLIVDVVVRPEYQHKGIGRHIVERLLEYVESNTPKGGRSSVQLIAAKGKEDFYTNMGFKVIPHEHCGSGMRKVIRK